MKTSTKIVLRGHEYAAPRTESVEITNQGVLCGSGGGGAKFTITGMGKGSL